jgi:CRISPR-associated protein Cas2
MTLHENTGWVVCYDIREKRRLVRVHRHLKKWGVPLQYSVFLVEATATKLHRLMAELEDLMDTSVDDVRAYRFPPGSECHTLGASILPDDVLINAPPPKPTPRRIRVTDAAALLP